MAASVLTLFGANPKQSGSSALLLTLSTPAASTSTTGWGVADVNGATYSRMTTTIERPRLQFQTTAQPSGEPLNAAEDCFRLSAVTTGQFSAGTWYSSLSVIAVTSGGDQDGRLRCRVWRSVNADGTSATELTAGTMVGSNTTDLSTTVAQSSSASTQMAASNLTDEYLFWQVAWENNSLVGTNTRDCLIRFGSLLATSGTGLVTSAFSAITPGGVVTDGGYYQRRRSLDAICSMDEV